jgi:Kef-type K+ transport system membrane component KefB
MSQRVGSAYGIIYYLFLIGLNTVFMFLWNLLKRFLKLSSDHVS